MPKCPQPCLGPALPCARAQPAPSLWAGGCFCLHVPSVTAVLLSREGAYVSFPASRLSRGAGRGHKMVPEGGWGPTRQGEPGYSFAPSGVGQGAAQSPIPTGSAAPRRAGEARGAHRDYSPFHAGPAAFQRYNLNTGRTPATPKPGPRTTAPLVSRANPPPSLIPPAHGKGHPRWGRE